MGILLLVFFGLFMALGVPVAVAMGGGAIAALLVSGKYPVLIVIHKMVAGVDSYVLLAIPFFILAANIMNNGGITRRIFTFADKLVGSIPGGMGHANIVSSIFFSGMSGSAVADASGLGQIIINAMDEQGYDPEFSAAVTAASATIGPIIPPSIPMVVFGAMAEVSVGALFLGGFIPGLLLGIASMILVYIIAKKRNYPRSSALSLPDLWASIKDAFLALMAPVIIIGGIIAGICTPTEAAMIATVYALFLSLLYKQMSLKRLAQVLLETSVMSATIIFIIAGATSFAWLIAVEGIPQAATSYILSLTTNPHLILLLLNAVLLLMGMFMEGLSVLTITIPFLMPLVHAVGLNPVHLGVMVVLNLMIGLSTPPVGLSLFICGKVANVKLEVLYKEILPFLVPLLVVLLIISFFPDTVLFLPELVLGR